jgi:fumarylacetoacetate (FAA) hydrolase
MKLASLREGGRDGTLIVVSRALDCAATVPGWPTLRGAIENWGEAEPALRAASDKLVGEGVGFGDSAAAKSPATMPPGARFAFDPARCSAPLPRAFQWLDGSAYLSHAELVRKARGAEMPPILYREPMMYQGAADDLLGPRDDIVLPDEAHGIDLEAEIAVIVDDVPMGVTVDEASRHIKLLMIANDVSLRNLMPDELSKQFGFLNSKPSTAFSPVAVTPDEAGAAWDGRKLALPLVSAVNSREIGRPNGAVDLNFDFAELIAHAARTRNLKAGTIIGSGTVSNRDEAAGVACLQELRMREKIKFGKIVTDHLRFGDTVTIEMTDADGGVLFGAIEQRVVPAH